MRSSKILDYQFLQLPTLFTLKLDELAVSKDLKLSCIAYLAIPQQTTTEENVSFL
jgi:hypothetical protein